MSQAASQAAIFYRDVARGRRVWTIRDGAGYPAPRTEAGRAQPFWSSLKRAKRVVETVPAYRGFEVVEINLDDLLERWLPGLSRDGISLGLNWSGQRATGYDVDAGTVRRGLDAALGQAVES